MFVEGLLCNVLKTCQCWIKCIFFFFFSDKWIFSKMFIFVLCPKHTNHLVYFTERKIWMCYWQYVQLTGNERNKRVWGPVKTSTWSSILSFFVDKYLRPSWLISRKEMGPTLEIEYLSQSGKGCDNPCFYITEALLWLVILSIHGFSPYHLTYLHWGKETHPKVICDILHDCTLPCHGPCRITLTANIAKCDQLSLNRVLWATRLLARWAKA